MAFYQLLQLFTQDCAVKGNEEQVPQNPPARQLQGHKKGNMCLTSITLARPYRLRCALCFGLLPRQLEGSGVEYLVGLNLASVQAPIRRTGPYKRTGPLVIIARYNRRCLYI